MSKHEATIRKMADMSFTDLIDQDCFITGATAVMDNLDIDENVLLAIFMRWQLNPHTKFLPEIKRQILDALTIKEK